MGGLVVFIGFYLEHVGIYVASTYEKKLGYFWLQILLLASNTNGEDFFPIIKETLAWAITTWILIVGSSYDLKSLSTKST